MTVYALDGLVPVVDRSAFVHPQGLALPCAAISDESS
jgi:hypothetical protein